MRTGDRRFDGVRIPIPTVRTELFNWCGAPESVNKRPKIAIVNDLITPMDTCGGFKSQVGREWHNGQK
jgi:hypothetical protein